MRAPEGESYVPAFPLGKPIVNFTITEVIKSNNSEYKVGQHLYGHTSFEEYVVLGAEQLKALKLIENKEGLPWSNVSLYFARPTICCEMRVQTGTAIAVVEARRSFLSYRTRR